MRTLHADLLTAQTAGYPTGGYQPAVSCLFQTANTATGTTSYDASFDPTSTTNQLKYIEVSEQITGVDSGIVLINNNKRNVPENLIGYYTDIGFGLNTSSGIHAGSSDGATVPRQWVMRQSEVSGGAKGAKPQLYSVFNTQGVWGAILNLQPLRLGFSPFFRDEDGLLGNKTLYGCLEYLIETSLTAQVGITFTLDALGTQDDGQINSVIPFPIIAASAVAADSTYHILTLGDTAFTALGAITAAAGSLEVGKGYRIVTAGTTDWVGIGAANTVVGTFLYATAAGSGNGSAIEADFIANTAGTSAGTTTGTLIAPPLRTLNEGTPGQFETYGEYLKRLLEPTSCYLIPRANLAFKIIYPQASDTVLETYYNSNTSGHPFYETENSWVNLVANHIQVFGGLNPDTNAPTVSGDWYDSAHFTGTAYTGNFVPTVRTIWEQNLASSAECTARATALGLQMKDQLMAARVTIPIDASVELGDRIKVQDQRGH